MQSWKNSGLSSPNPTSCPRAFFYCSTTHLLPKSTLFPSLISSRLLGTISDPPPAPLLCSDNVASALPSFYTLKSPSSNSMHFHLHNASTSWSYSSSPSIPWMILISMLYSLKLKAFVIGFSSIKALFLCVSLSQEKALVIPIYWSGHAHDCSLLLS